MANMLRKLLWLVTCIYAFESVTTAEESPRPSETPVPLAPTAASPPPPATAVSPQPPAAPTPPAAAPTQAVSPPPAPSPAPSPSPTPAPTPAAAPTQTPTPPPPPEPTPAPTPEPTPVATVVELTKSIDQPRPNEALGQPIAPQEKVATPMSREPERKSSASPQENLQDNDASNNQDATVSSSFSSTRPNLTLTIAIAGVVVVALLLTVLSMRKYQIIQMDRIANQDKEDDWRHSHPITLEQAEASFRMTTPMMTPATQYTVASDAKDQPNPTNEDPAVDNRSHHEQQRQSSLCSLDEEREESMASVYQFLPAKPNSPSAKPQGSILVTPNAAPRPKKTVNFAGMTSAASRRQHVEAGPTTIPENLRQTDSSMSTSSCLSLDDDDSRFGSEYFARRGSSGVLHESIVIDDTAAFLEALNDDERQAVQSILAQKRRDTQESAESGDQRVCSEFAYYL